MNQSQSMDRRGFLLRLVRGGAAVALVTGVSTLALRPTASCPASSQAPDCGGCALLSRGCTLEAASTARLAASAEKRP